MTNFLEYLSKDTLPDSLLREFVEWCIWEQARPALVNILKRTGLDDYARNLSLVDDLSTFSQLSEAAGKSANEARKKTGPLGLSSAEAASFIGSKMATSAMEENFDAEGVAFFAAQLCGWDGFAKTSFSDGKSKLDTEEEARKQQEAKLRELWAEHEKKEK